MSENKKYANEMIPGDVFHPGELLSDEIEARGMTQKALAQSMNISSTMLNEIIKGKRNLTPALAIKLENALGIDAEVWMRLQVSYEINTIRIRLREQLNKTDISPSKKQKIQSSI